MASKEDCSVWNLTADAVVHFVGHKSDVWGMALDQNGPTMVSFGRGKSIRFWDARNGVVMEDRMKTDINAISIASTGKLGVALSSAKGWVWELGMKMSVPSSQCVKRWGKAISALLQKCGLQLLEQPLRLEGWLRDIYPEHRAPVSVAMEALQTQCHLEASHSGCLRSIGFAIGLSTVGRFWCAFVEVALRDINWMYKWFNLFRAMDSANLVAWHKRWTPYWDIRDWETT